MRATISMLLGAALLLPCADAHADAPEPTAATSGENYWSQLRGPEFTTHVGIGGFVRDSSTAFTNEPQASNHQYWPNVGGQVTMGYRFLPWLSAGAHVAYQFNNSRDLPTGTTGGQANSFGAGGYIRFYLAPFIHTRTFDPWLSAGVDPYYGIWAGHTLANGAGIVSRFDTVAIPITLGIDHSFNKYVALSGISQIMPAVPFQRCDRDPTGISNCTSSNLTANTFLFAGIGVRFTVPRAGW